MVLRLPAVAGRFYPSNPAELTALVRQYTKAEPGAEVARVKACLVPHAGYMYSGHVVGAVLSRIAVPQKLDEESTKKLAEIEAKNPVDARADIKW